MDAPVTTTPAPAAPATAPQTPAPEAPKSSGNESWRPKWAKGANAPKPEVETDENAEKEKAESTTEAKAEPPKEGRPAVIRERTGNLTEAGKPVEAGKPTDGKPVEPAPKRKYELTVDGKTEVRELSDDDIKTLLQKESGVSKRMQEAVMEKRRYEAERAKVNDAFAMFRENPMAVMQQLGVKPAEAIQRILDQTTGSPELRAPLEKALWDGYLQYEAMTPEQREQFAKDQELESYRQRDQQTQQTQQEQENQERFQKTLGNMHQEIIQVLEANPDLPKENTTVARIALFMQADRAKHGQVSPARVINEVRADIYKSTRHVINTQQTGEDLAKLIGEEGRKKLREYELNLVKNPNGGQKADARPLHERVLQTPSSQKNKPMTQQEWRDRNKRLKETLS